MWQIRQTKRLRGYNWLGLARNGDTYDLQVCKSEQCDQRYHYVGIQTRDEAVALCVFNLIHSPEDFRRLEYLLRKLGHKAVVTSLL